MSKIHQNNLPKGVYPVVPTPLLRNETLDLNGLRRCLDFYLSSSISGITVLGSGGELPYLTDSEQLAVVKHTHDVVVETGNSKIPVIVGVNAFGVKQAINKIEQYQGMADAIMLLFNGYYQQSFSELKQAVKAVVERSPMPVLYYHFPQVSGHFLSAKQIIEILNETGVVGIKDSALHLRSAKTVLKHCPQTAYFSGLSLLLPDLIGLGVSGAICPIGAIAPVLTAKLCKAYLIKEEQHLLAALREQLIRLLPIVSDPKNTSVKQYTLLRLAVGLPFTILKQATSPQAHTKEALRLLGIDIEPTVRQPLPSLSNSASKAIASHLRAAQLL